MKTAITALVVLLGLVVAIPASAETIKARVLNVDQRKNQVRVDVAGSGRDYQVNDRSLYRVLQPGRLVIITAELVNGRHTIVDARDATQRGRIEAFDERSGSVTIRGDGGPATYNLDAGVAGRGFRVGDTVDFEVEERGRRNVITRWTRVGGGYDRDRDRDRPETLRDGGRVTDIDNRRTQITVELESNGRRQTFDVADKQLMNNLRNGDRVRFEFERRGDRFVITSLR